LSIRGWAVGINTLVRLTIDFPEHAPHLLHIVKVKEERLGISFILLERNSEPVDSRKCGWISARKAGKCGGRRMEEGVG
jgi:hypothetical protein